MKPNYLPKIVIVLILSIIVIAAMMYFDEMNDKAIAPFDEQHFFDISDNIDDTDALLYLPPETSEAEEDEPQSDTLTEPSDAPEDDWEGEYIDPGYVAVHMLESDIARGTLILVNHENEFVFPSDDENDLVTVPELLIETVGVTSENTILSATILDSFNVMMDRFYNHSNVSNVVIRSAFRSMSAQQQIFDGMVRRWGRAGARLWAALPGHSEHHTGLAFDFGIRRSGQIEMFEGTDAYVWIPRNSHNFGFILRYPNGKTDITQTNYEPWHYRYVGVPHASIIRSNGWVLEEYIENIKSYSFEEPLIFVHTINDIETEYSIYYTSELEVKIPYDVEFSISGNNVDGFIITVWQ